MSQDYSQKVFQGKVFFPKLPFNQFLITGEEGEVQSRILPTYKREIFYQSVPSSSWEFVHDFGVSPIATVYDSVGNELSPPQIDIYIDDSIVRISTDIEFTGRVEIQALGVGVPEISVIAQTIKITRVSDNYSVQSSDRLIVVDASLKDVVVTLLDANSVKEQMFSIKKIDDSTHKIIIKDAANYKIDGENSIIFSTQYNCYSFVSSGMEWFIV